MDKQAIKQEITNGKTALGIELGSTRIKVVLVASDFSTIASGGFDWENKLEDGNWTYSLEDIWAGVQAAYAEVAQKVGDEYAELQSIGSMGFSGMMHGYMAFDDKGELLVPFRTWRNSSTWRAAKMLSKLFNFNIPQRFSISHLYQAILDQESHVKNVDFITTLGGYIHWKVTGEKILGVGDASGMFPIDSVTDQFDHKMLQKFRNLKAVQQYRWDIADVLPAIRLAGEEAGHLTAAGAALIDPTGNLQPGSIVAAPEGDAGTGMVATNSVKQRTANISAGTSAFAMVVLEKPLAQVYEVIDMVTTPDGSAVAMVHANNSSSDINAWAKLFGEFAKAIGTELTSTELYSALFNSVKESQPNAGELLSYGYYSGENITGMDEGRPLLVRTPTSEFSLGNLMRMNLYSAFGAMKIGLDILKEEEVTTDSVVAQGGIFKTPVIAQSILAAIMGAPVTVMANAGEGGPWAMAILSQFVTMRDADEKLADFLDNKVFKDVKRTTLEPDQNDVIGFAEFMKNYNEGLIIERAAIEHYPAK
ncbi:ATPase [Periweissella cryptocerci]|uniref:ATPase n=1 Tax=Periweissella cryptocerci TaxID=2506420 RepID=A0A4P6YV70_9LACO|nr:FGGY-family carbohydrate kinase [Periweissella cryptocerci]QBO36709.1 ATPase [Periweissella cryptocerci]